MKRLGFGMVVVYFVFMLYCCPSAWAQSRTPAITKWEYRIETSCGKPEQEHLDQLGQDGWELATAYSKDNSCQSLVFKRPLSKNAPTIAKAKPTPTPTPAPACTMTLEQAPIVRGLRLGLTATELAAILPESKRNIESVLKQRITRQTQAMQILYFQNFAQRYSPSEEEKALDKQFAPATNVSISFFKDKVAELRIEYRVSSDLPQWNAQNWIQKLAESYGLPSFESWQKPKGAEGYALTCVGFEVRIPNYYSPLAFTLSDTQAVANAKQWLADEDVRLRREFKP
jgi:hypothetical protein